MPFVHIPTQNDEQRVRKCPSAILSLFATCLIGNWSVSLVRRVPLYRALSHDFMARKEPDEATPG
jgi:hypothetical protein